MGVAGEDELDGPPGQKARVVLRVVGEENVVAGLGLEALEPEAAGVAEVEVAVLDRVAGRVGSEAVAEDAAAGHGHAGQAADDDAPPVQVDGGVGAVQQHRALGAQQLHILLADHPLMVAQRVEGGCQLGAGAQEGEHVFLHLGDEGVVVRLDAQQQVAGDGDELRALGAQRAEHLVGGHVVQVRGHGDAAHGQAGNAVKGFNHACHLLLFATE